MTRNKLYVIINKIKYKVIKTVEAEIKSIMPLQRVCIAEKQARNNLANGPQRVQSNAFFAKYTVTCGIRKLPRGMLVLCMRA